jgi:hypothetical protein
MSRRLLILSALAALLPLAGCGNNAPKPAATTAPSLRAPVPRPPQPPGNAPAAHHPGGSSNVELPATYTLNQSQSLTPSTVSAPKAVPIVLTVVSRDARPATVTVRSNPPHTLNVPASGRATTRLGVLPPSTYTVTVNGIPRARLIVGVQPGP